MLFLFKVGGEAYTQYYNHLYLLFFLFAGRPYIINADYTLQMYDYYVIHILQRPRKKSC